MNIVSVQALALDVGFQNQPLATSRVAAPMSRWQKYSAQRSSWAWLTKKVFVRVESQDGAVGWSFTNGGEVVALIIESQLSRLTTNGPIESIPDLWDQMMFAILPVDRSGFVMMAIAAVDIALWDLKAKMEGKSLVELLGGLRQERLTTYATTTNPEALAEDGWWGLKAAMPFGLEGGAEGMDENVQLMQRFRDVAGADSRIMLDSFMSWDADYTLAFAEKCDSLDLYWIEDPLPPYDLTGFRKIRETAGDSIRLALGNFCFSRWDCELLIREGLVDVLQPDVAWAGGITECLRILDTAEAADIPVILHNTYEQPWAVALAGSRQDDPIIEFVDRGPQSQIYSLMGPALRQDSGYVEVPLSTDGNTPPPEVVTQFSNA